LENSSQDQHRYRQLCEKEQTIPLFSQAWWLDATCGPDRWDVAVVEKGGEIMATLPYLRLVRAGMTKLTMPALTQKLGPWFRPQEGRYAQQLAQRKNLIDSLLDRLPRHDWFAQNLDYRVDDCLPWHWRGFLHTTRVTYVLEDISDTKTVWDSMQSVVRRNIRKARVRFELKVKDDLGIEEFLPLNQQTYQRQEKEVPYTPDLVRRLDQACVARGVRKLLFAVDSQNRTHAAVYLVWDATSAYYLMGGSDPVLRDSAAGSLLLWESIQFASGVAKSFDFEGSMIEPIARHFGNFGGVQKDYYRMERINNRWIGAAVHLRNAAKHLMSRPVLRQDDVVPESNSDSDQSS
jgi:hypothetical protein